MNHAKVAIAASSSLSAEAGAKIAKMGGNAVDAAITTTIVSMCTDIGVMAPGGSGFITLTTPQQDPITIDAYAAMPGLGVETLPPQDPVITFDYGGLTQTHIGYKSIAVPGIWRGLALASERYGQLSWSDLLIPAQEAVKYGFNLLHGGAEYLKYSHDVIFGWHPQSNAVIHHEDKKPKSKGEIINIPDLAESLAIIARDGVDAFYQGEIAQKIVQEIQRNQGILNALDLASYQAIIRESIDLQLQEWHIFTNPAPAIGGACLAALLLLLDNQTWVSKDICTNLIKIQDAVLNYRANNLQENNELMLKSKIKTLLNLATQGNLKSPSTIHTSAVDINGIACSISASAGYGSGVMIEGTGLWLNNSLGEIELHPNTETSLMSGTRLISNMAPTIAKKEDGDLLAIGSPGASRITTAISQVLYYFIQQGMPLEEAISHPRLHVEKFHNCSIVSYEEDLSVHLENHYQTRLFPALSMYFGGVQAAYYHPQEGLLAVADLRREGGIAYA